MTFYSAVPMVVSRQFDDEVVLASYENGLYYSLTGSGADIWVGLRSGYAVDEIVATLSKAFPSDIDRIPLAVQEFVQRLVNEGLLAKRDLIPNREDWSPTTRGGFCDPVLDRFDDLKDLLLLDPVHDVNEAGWPIRMDNAT